MEPIHLLWFLTVVGLIYCEEGGVRLEVRAGSDVVLPCSLNNKDIEPALFVWKKDDRQDVFLYDAGTHYNNGRQGQDEQFKGRVSHFPDELINGNASIIIRNTRQSDSGNYTCDFPHIQRFLIELLVGVSPKPRVMILSITPDWALLQCEVRRAFPKTQIVWRDSDGIILPAEEKLEDSDDPHCPPALTLQTNVTKTSNFRCVVTQQEPHHMTEVHIHVPLGSDNMKTKCVGVIAGAGVCDLVVFSTVLAAFLICWKIGWFRYIRRTMRERRDRDRHSDLENDPERHTCDKLCHMDGCPERRERDRHSDLENDPERHTCDKLCRMDGCPERRDRDMDSDLENDPVMYAMDSNLENDPGRRDSDTDSNFSDLVMYAMDSNLENDPERCDSDMDSDLENDPEQPLNTEEDTEPGVATVEPDGTVRYTCKNLQNSSHGLY